MHSSSSTFADTVQSVLSYFVQITDDFINNKHCHNNPANSYLFNYMNVTQKYLNIGKDKVSSLSRSS